MTNTAIISAAHSPTEVAPSITQRRLEVVPFTHIARAPGIAASAPMGPRTIRQRPRHIPNPRGARSGAALEHVLAHAVEKVVTPASAAAEREDVTVLAVVHRAADHHVIVGVDVHLDIDDAL